MVRKRFHGLKRPRIRQDFSKETLYNLSRLTTPGAANRTFFQQKWTAKSMARAYHNPYVREGQWTRMFDRRLPAVVSMSHQYLAKYDGSEMALGRGMGLEVDSRRRDDGREGVAEGEDGESQVLRKRDGRVEKTPYMHMTFHPLERRLDTAIWRALFSSSTKQARQFVVHGWVKVNEKKMVYPGYQLNPGDMFSVDPERVMFATGARKSKKGSPVSDQEAEDRRVERNAAKSKEAAAANNSEAEEGLEEVEEDEDSDAGAATLESDEDREAMTTKPEDEQDARKAMKNLVLRAKRILEDSKRKLSGKRQQELRSFAQSVRKTMAKHRPSDAVLAEGSSSETNSISDFETALAEIMTKIPSDSLPTQSTSAAQSDATAAASSNPQMQQPEKTDEYNAARDAALLSQALDRARENPIDVSKPYATPWQPRAFMSAFAFIPRYLEVNQNVCSAVYLRHPVARPGLAEVPTPFGGEVMGLAFNWYLRRR
ncbi:hypothetical protein LTR56_005857 [Elasticomyces elasticus]|nr:hypothetical protein LTR56_005857 [Elasticomyces elasticus]KAK3664917.1 hypothetical protein LTR22_004223 [Elasticomyces elasticus]KAK4933490.1 hypothetical protein LTR49_000484 [Elasticomyces elasticus]KAK5756421.1 hypothetical protein LTS12_013493 [Elasticomyces elasticus]